MKRKRQTETRKEIEIINPYFSKIKEEGGRVPGCGKYNTSSKHKKK
jgi:hypothetical protein